MDRVLQTFNDSRLRRRRAFTLIELLIVVAIVAILSAVAVPNFLEAQTRAKSARARADMRTLVTGLECYRIDQGGYIPPTGNGIPSRLWRLSSPVAYIREARLADPFGDRRSGRRVDHEIEYWGCNERRTALASNAEGALLTPQLGGGQSRVMWYFLRSAGPDEDVNPEGASWKTWLDCASLVAYLYDPSNGTVSAGEIFRAGGEPAGGFGPGMALVSGAQ